MRGQAEKSRQVVFVDDDGLAHMAWEISFFADSARGGSPTSPLVIVDAASGTILKQLDALKNAEIGTGPGGNEKTGQYRSEERRVGKECVSKCRSRWSPYH